MMESGNGEIEAVDVMVGMAADVQAAAFPDDSQRRQKSRMVGMMVRASPWFILEVLTAISAFWPSDRFA